MTASQDHISDYRRAEANPVRPKPGSLEKPRIERFVRVRQISSFASPERGLVERKRGGLSTCRAVSRHNSSADPDFQITSWNLSNILA